MKQILVCLYVSLKLAPSALADENASWIQSIAFRSIVANKYLASNIGFTVYNKPVVQSSLIMGFKNGFHIDLWNSTPIEGFNQNFGTEQDFGFGWNGFLSTLGANKSSDTVLDLGISYFDEPGLLEFGADDILYGYAKLSGVSNKATFWVMYEGYVVMPGSSYTGGNHIGVGMDKDRIAIDDWTGLNVSLATVYDTGALGFNSGIFFRGTVGFDWQITESFSVIFPHFDFCMPVTAMDRPSDLVISAGFSFEI